MNEMASREEGDGTVTVGFRPPTEKNQSSKANITHGFFSGMLPGSSQDDRRASICLQNDGEEQAQSATVCHAQ